MLLLHVVIRITCVVYPNGFKRQQNLHAPAVGKQQPTQIGVRLYKHQQTLHVAAWTP
jgi:hypothetical protein